MENATRAEEFNRSICMRRSADGGATWSALQPNITQRYAANPSAVHDVSRSRTLLFFDDARSGGLYFMASADGGETWGAAVPLRNASGGALSGVSGPGNSVVAMTNGDLLSASYHADRNTSRPGWNSFSHAKVLRSSDGGESWHDVSPVDPLSGEQMFPHLGEPSLTLTPKGTLVFDSRCPDGRKPYPGPAAPCDCDCRGVSTSNDGGSTWGEMVYDPAVPDPDCQGSIVALANGSLAFSNANDPTYRVNPSVRLGRVVGAGAQAVEWDAAVTQLATTSASAGTVHLVARGGCHPHSCCGHSPRRHRVGLLFHLPDRLGTAGRALGDAGAASGARLPRRGMLDCGVLPGLTAETVKTGVREGRWRSIGGAGCSTCVRLVRTGPVSAARSGVARLRGGGRQGPGRLAGPGLVEELSERRRASATLCDR